MHVNDVANFAVMPTMNNIVADSDKMYLNERDLYLVTYFLKFRNYSSKLSEDRKDITAAICSDMESQLLFVSDSLELGAEFEDISQYCYIYNLNYVNSQNIQQLYEMKSNDINSSMLFLKKFNETVLKPNGIHAN